MATVAPVVVRLCQVFIAALATMASQIVPADPGSSASIKLSNAVLNVLNLTNIIPIHGEMIVSFGNTSSGNLTRDVGMNSNGILDADYNLINFGRLKLIK